MSKTLLVVEDEPMIGEMGVEFLTDTDLIVDQAGTALETLTKRASEFCLLFTDVRMPGKLDGSPAS